MAPIDNSRAFANYDQWKTTDPSLDYDAEVDGPIYDGKHLCDDDGNHLTDPMKNGTYIGNDEDGVYVEWAIHPTLPIGVIHTVCDFDSVGYCGDLEYDTYDLSSIDFGKCVMNAAYHAMDVMLTDEPMDDLDYPAIWKTIDKMGVCASRWAKEEVA
jgi:hypothetical protein